MKEWRNPRYAFGPRAPFTTAGSSHRGLCGNLCGPKVLGWGHQTCWGKEEGELCTENGEEREKEQEEDRDLAQICALMV